MRIFKFGGASVKNASGVQNLAKVLKTEGIENTLVVVSAMGKMTNAFEALIASYLDQSDNFQIQFNAIKKFHHDIIIELFTDTSEIELQMSDLFGTLASFFVKNTSNDYDFVYDQVVGFGELASTSIISHYLNTINIENEWLDVRRFIKTDESYRDAKIHWEETCKRINGLSDKKLYITQGFLGASESNNTTTLGREGSDFTAAIFAYCMDAQSVTIWKDVSGVLNADPRAFSNPVLLQQISYDEAIEMAFYGASVIHPKTIKPIENKNIPLFVRSFYDLKNPGTMVTNGHYLLPETPCFILKKNQILLSVSALDFSFMVEYNISHVFRKLHEYKLKVNLIQNSAISFIVCVEDKYHQFDRFIEDIKNGYDIQFERDLVLYTIRHANSKAIQEIESLGEVRLNQSSKGTVQMILKTA